MDEKFNYGAISSCTPEDCSSCAGCGSDVKLDEAHHTISLTMDDDTEVECSILTIFSVEENEYIALLPLNEEGVNTDGEVYLYKFSLSDSGDPMLDNIEDEAEYQAAAQAFDEVVQKAMEEEAQAAPY